MLELEGTFNQVKTVIVKLRECSSPALLFTAPLCPRCNAAAACVCLRHYLATEMWITIAADLFLQLPLCLLQLLPDPDPDQQLCSIYSLVPGDYQLMWVIMSIMTSGMLSRPVNTALNTAAATSSLSQNI